MMMVMMDGWMLVVSQLVVISYSRWVVGNEAELRGLGKNACICTTKQARVKESVQVRTQDGGTHAK
jgi:hypothetical protein